MRRLLLLPLSVGCALHPVNVHVRGAAVGPGDWDGLTAAVPAITDTAIAAMAAYDPFAAGVGVATLEATVAGYGPPDVVGNATLTAGGQRTIVALPRVENSFTPLWTASSFTNVLLAPGTTLQVRLVDDDPLNDDDPIGEVVIDDRQLRRALHTRGPLRIDTAEATGNQLVWVAVEVTPAPKLTR